MGSKLFDNIMQVIKSRNTIASTTIVSNEIDFELPRGFVAKIHKVVVQVNDVWDKLTSTESIRIEFALLLDPDDALTTQMPFNQVEHDVVLDGEYNTQNHGATAFGDGTREAFRQYDFSHLEGMDIISARNMRFNIVNVTDEVDGAFVECVIWYTLEEIKDTQIMELLDIL